MKNTDQNVVHIIALAMVCIVSIVAILAILSIVGCKGLPIIITLILLPITFAGGTQALKAIKDVVGRILQ